MLARSSEGVPGLEPIAEGERLGKSTGKASFADAASKHVGTFNVGDRVQGRFAADDKWYPGKVDRVRVFIDGHVTYSIQCARRFRAQPRGACWGMSVCGLSDLCPGGAVRWLAVRRR